MARVSGACVEQPWEGKGSGGKKTPGMAVLMWISHSRRRLRVGEICHMDTLAIWIGLNGLNSGDIPAISTLLGCYRGFVTVGMGASTVRLIHNPFYRQRISLHTLRPHWQSPLDDGGNLLDISKLLAHQGSSRQPVP